MQAYKVTNFRISSSLKRGSECSSVLKKVIIRIALFWRIIKGLIEEL